MLLKKSNLFSLNFEKSIKTVQFKIDLPKNNAKNYIQPKSVFTNNQSKMNSL